MNRITSQMAKLRKLTFINPVLEWPARSGRPASWAECKPATKALQGQAGRARTARKSRELAPLRLIRRHASCGSLRALRPAAPARLAAIRIDVLPSLYDAAMERRAARARGSAGRSAPRPPPGHAASGRRPTSSSSRRDDPNGDGARQTDQQLPLDGRARRFGSNRPATCASRGHADERLGRRRACGRRNARGAARRARAPRAAAASAASARARSRYRYWWDRRPGSARPRRRRRADRPDRRRAAAGRSRGSPTSAK